MRFDSSLDIRMHADDLSFEFGPEIFHSGVEKRSLDAIRSSLRDPDCDGPDPVYCIAMDVGKPEHLENLKKRNLLFGVVGYAKGQLGEEPVRSQGHVHAVATHCGWSTPELIEIWEGTAIIFLQKRTTDDPECCFAIEARPGEHVVIPPAWAHCVVNADPKHRMLFGAWCVRQYAFVYDEVRAHGGLAYFPIVTEEGRLHWEANAHYRSSSLEICRARSYPELGLRTGIPIYRQYEEDPESVQWISDPVRKTAVWDCYQP